VGFRLNLLAENRCESGGKSSAQIISSARRHGTGCVADHVAGAGYLKGVRRL
jgi:hypothetical protein